MAEALLEVSGLSAGYGGATVLQALSFSIAAGESLALLGRNGAGKSTLLASLLGLTQHRGGAIRFGGRDITGLRPHQRARLGIGWVPQERNIFKSLSVEENLTAVQRSGRWNAARVFELFPNLAARRHNLGSQLSGGEQQLLAIGRALVLNPQLLLLDEPLEGLAPLIAAQVLEVMRNIIGDEGLAVIVVEQHARKILAITDRAMILERGEIALQSTSAELLARGDELDGHLGVSGGVAA